MNVSHAFIRLALKIAKSFSSVGIFTLESPTVETTVVTKVGYCTAVGVADGASEGNLKSQSPQVNGQLFWTTGCLLQRHHESLRRTQAHDLIRPSPNLKRSLLSVHLQKSHVTGQCSFTSSIPQRNHVLADAHLQLFLCRIHGILSIVNLLEISLHQPYFWVGAALVVGETVGTLMVTTGEGLGTFVVTLHSPQVSGQLSRTCMNRLHLHFLLFRTHAQSSVICTPFGLIVSNGPVTSS